MIFLEKVHAKNIYLFSRMAGILEPICYICEQVGVYIFIVYFSIWEGGEGGEMTQQSLKVCFSIPHKQHFVRSW